MGISLKTHKLLWGKSGSKCAFEECRHDLIADETETDDESIIGDEAHIVARNVDGPRGISSLTPEERDKYDNLILLCRKHHKIADDQSIFYTVEKLRDIKASHEKWVFESLTVDKIKEKTDLTYASYIDEIVNSLDFEHWNAWTSWTFGNSSMSYARFKAFEELPNYIIGRFWPHVYIDLEDSIYNIKAIVNDLLMVFNKHLDRESLKIREGEDLEVKSIDTERFYSLIYYEDQNVYNELLSQYEYHTDLIDDLMFELTRAGNLLIEKIRNYIYPMYREEGGKLLITTGPHFDFSYRTSKLEYGPEEKLEKYQYKGLWDFMTTRENRDKYMGGGVSKKYLPFKFE
jgi:hypothetical protein